MCFYHSNLNIVVMLVRNFMEIDREIMYNFAYYFQKLINCQLYKISKIAFLRINGPYLKFNSILDLKFYTHLPNNQ